MKITVLIENTAPSQELAAEHGLSLGIEYRGGYYLLDTGSSGAFALNAERLRFPLDKVDACFLSHGHYDHAGGLSAFFDRNAQAVVYAMEGACDTFYSGDGEKRHPIGIPGPVLQRLPGRISTVKELTQCRPGIWLLPHSTPGLESVGAAKKLYREVDGGVRPDDFSHEMTVVFETERGLLLFNSCCHGGLQTVLEEAARAFPGQKLYGFVGGLHMKGSRNGQEICTFTREELQAVADAAAARDLEAVYTGHCTGGVAYALLEPVMGQRLHGMTTGQTILLPDQGE